MCAFVTSSLHPELPLLATSAGQRHAQRDLGPRSRAVKLWWLGTTEVIDSDATVA